MQNLYALQIMHLYKLKGGYYCIDDTMKHHTNYCKWIHGVFVLFDHAMKTNLKAICVVVLYYNDGGTIKFPIAHRIYYQDTEKMPWQNGKKSVCKPKYELAIPGFILSQEAVVHQDARQIVSSSPVQQNGRYR